MAILFWEPAREQECVAAWCLSHLDDIEGDGERYGGKAIVWEVRGGHFGASGDRVLALVDYLRGILQQRADVYVRPSENGFFDIHVNSLIVPRRVKSISPAHQRQLDDAVRPLVPAHRLRLESARFGRFAASLIWVAWALVVVYTLTTLEVKPLELAIVRRTIPAEAMLLFPLFILSMQWRTWQKRVLDCKRTFGEDDARWCKEAPSVTDAMAMAVATKVDAVLTHGPRKSRRAVAAK